MTTSDPAPLTFRPPSSSQAANTTTFAPPSLDFLYGTWHVTHSTLPMWKKNRNVRITYKPVDAQPDFIDDLVEYQPLSSTKQKTVQGIDKPHPTTKAAYNWRGKGMLKIASSQWEVLGHGEEEGGWAVTFFEKTLFTPAGVDVYAKRQGGLSEELLGRIKGEIARVGEGDTNVKRLAGEMFEIQHDWEGSGKGDSDVK